MTMKLLLVEKLKRYLLLASIEINVLSKIITVYILMQ